MAFELILLGALIFIFIVSFCGLLQKIKQTYDRERILAERIARRREQEQMARRSDSYTEVYLNPAFSSDGTGGVFPSVPPPYSQYYVEPPPKYEEVVKVHRPSESSPSPNETSSPEVTPEHRSSQSSSPPYTITVS